MANIQALGELINWVDVRNKGVISDNLLGINIDKFFMPSVANIIGTDLSSYKLIRKKQFACNPMHVGRDEKMPIALYMDDSPSIVSPAYFVFEIKDAAKVNPEYLMLWFRRAEFDRECWYHTDGSVRGGITWDEILEMTVPVPSIEEQNELVKSYSDIGRRIQIKKEINDNLEAQAITLFNEYFMFEIENAEHTFGEYVSFAQGTQVPVDEQLSSNKPNTVRFVRIIDYTTDGQEPPRYIYPPNNSTYINDDEVAVVRYGNIGLIGRRFSGIIANNLFKVVPKNLEITNHFIYYYLNHPKIQRILKSSEESSAMPAIKHSTVANLPINSINSEQLHLFELFASKIERVIVENKGEIVSLSQMSTNILSSLASLSR